MEISKKPHSSRKDSSLIVEELAMFALFHITMVYSMQAVLCVLINSSSVTALSLWIPSLSQEHMVFRVLYVELNCICFNVSNNRLGIWCDV